MRSHTITPPVMRRRERGVTSEGRTVSSWAWPIGLGLVYGVYALVVEHGNGTGAGWAAVRGMSAAVVLAAVCYLIGRWQRTWPAEAVGTAYGVVCSVSMGYLLSLAGRDWLWSSLVGLAIGASLGLSTFYFVHMRGR